MKPEKQRIAIAGIHLGLLPIRGERISNCGHLIMLSHDGANTAFCPDYLNDLNSIHEAEKVLTDQQWFDYDLELMIATKCDGHVQRNRIHAAAAQRAEALLRTVGRWEE